MDVSRNVLFLGGPTCSGKSELAIALAERFDAEIVGADSRQIYRDMPIGTAAPTAAQRACVPHHLVAFLDPMERYNAARYARDATAAVTAIVARGRRAIVCGGTGFYLRALAGDVTLAAERDDDVRARLAREACVHPPEVLYDWLAALDPQRARALAPSDAYRIVRALEIALTRKSPIARDANPQPPTLRARGFVPVKIVLDVPTTELEARIDARTDVMLASGIVEEAERIGASAVAADAVGYPQIFAYLAGFSSQRELRASLARATRRYAKRQRTWFRSEVGVRYAAPGDIASIVQRDLGW